MRWKKTLFFILTKGIAIALLLTFFIFLMINITWEEFKIPLIGIGVMLVLSGYVGLLQWLDDEIKK